MALVVHVESVAAASFGEGAQRQRLLSAAQVEDTRVLLERWTLAPRGRADVDVPPESLAWFQVLDGGIALTHAGGEERLTPAHIVFLPPRFRGTLASGAEHFMYFTRGRGTAWANESPFPVKRGDLVRYADRERHYLRSDGAEDMVFVEFFVPGECRTVWAPGAAVCAWLPTGRDIEGRRPARKIAAHSSALVQSPRDV